MLIMAAGFFIAILKENVIGGPESWLPFAILKAIVCFSLITFQEFLRFIKENEMLGMKAFLDPLTGLYNRAYLMRMGINDEPSR